GPAAPRGGAGDRRAACGGATRGRQRAEARSLMRFQRSAVGALLLAAASAAGCVAPAPTVITITIHNSPFDLTDIEVPRGVPVTFIFVYTDPIDHEWLIGDEAFHAAHRTCTHAAPGDVPTEVTIPSLSTTRTEI